MHSGCGEHFDLAAVRPTAQRVRVDAEDAARLAQREPVPAVDHRPRDTANLGETWPEAKMARQAKPRGTTRPPYAGELHETALCALRAGRLPAELARELGVPTTTLRAWLRAADLAPAGWRPPRTEVLGRTIREYAHLDQLVARLSPRDFALRLPFDRSARDRWTIKTPWRISRFGRRTLLERRLGSVRRRKIGRP